MGKRVNDEVYARTNFDTKLVKKMKTDDIYMNEQEALKYGVIDKIIENLDELF